MSRRQLNVLLVEDDVVQRRLIAHHLAAVRGIRASIAFAAGEEEGVAAFLGRATDLVLSGTAVSSASPVHATSLTWIDAHTVEFNLSGNFNLPGTLDLSINPNMIDSTNGQGNQGYSDRVVVQIGTPPAPANPTPLPPGYNPNPTPTPTPTPT